MGLLSGADGRRRTVVVVAVASLAMFALGLGIALDRNRASTPEIVAPGAGASNAPPPVATAAAPGGALPGLDVMVERLEAKVQAGGTAEQWRLLGQTYVELGRTAEARQAFERAAALEPAAPATPPR